MDVLEYLKRIDAKLDALLKDRDMKMTRAQLCERLRISRYRLLKLFDEGYLDAFNPHKKLTNLTAEDLKAVEEADRQRICEKRA